MTRLGTILHIMNNEEDAIVRTNGLKTKIIGKKVVDKNIKEIGKVFDVFGPVKRPYLIIKLNKNIKNKKSLIGEIIYLYSKQKR